MHLLADLNARDGVTILAVLHDLSLATHFFPRALVLERGALVADGPAREVLGESTIRDVFGVDPAVVGLAGAEAVGSRLARSEAAVDAR
jgi:iron complex transport system ATP-binding protein